MYSLKIRLTLSTTKAGHSCF